VRFSPDHFTGKERDQVTCSPKSAHNRVRFSYSGVRAEDVEEQRLGNLTSNFVLVMLSIL
jgi:hypothetical protein